MAIPDEPQPWQLLLPLLPLLLPLDGISLLLHGSVTPEMALAKFLPQRRPDAGLICSGEKVSSLSLTCWQHRDGGDDWACPWTSLSLCGAEMNHWLWMESFGNGGSEYWQKAGCSPGETALLCGGPQVFYWHVLSLYSWSFHHRSGHSREPGPPGAQPKGSGHLAVKAHPRRAGPTSCC